MIKALPICLALAAAVFCLGGCKLNTNLLRQDTLDKTSGAEKMFFLESVSGASLDADTGALAREAARNGYVQVLRYLQGRGVDLNQADGEGWSPILIAASRGDLPAVRYLVEMAAADIRAKNNSRTTTLMLAARSGNLDLARYLLDRGANPNAKSVRSLTALMYGAASGNVDLAKLLVERGADTQVADGFGNNALAYASGAAMRDYLAALGLRP